MAYKVYLVEELDIDNWIELDCENVDFSTVFSVADIADVSVRKDTITKQIAFKGSRTNNEAFGNMFHLNRTSNLDIDNRLFFNYNPLRTVNCLVLEDNVLLLKGSLRVLEIDVDKYSNITYHTVITGSFIDFRNIVAEKNLSDLDFSDLKHRYTWENISQSWNIRTERYNLITSGYTYQPYQLGNGYVYPYIDYGATFKKLEANVDVNNVPLNNFRPAIYVKEYFNRIFKQEELKGYSWELKASDELKKRFDSLIIPNNTESLSSKSTTFNVSISSTGSTVHDRTHSDYGGVTNASYMSRPIKMDSLDQNDLLGYYGQLSEPNTVLLVKRKFTTNGKISVKINNMYNEFNGPVRVVFQLCSREFISSADAGFNDVNSFQSIVSSVPITIPQDAGISNRTIEFEVGERTYEENSQLIFKMFVESAEPLPIEVTGPYLLRYDISDAVVVLPKDINGLVTYDVQEGDEIELNPVEDVKQMDFIKSVLNIFNLYVYTEKERPKHLIFQPYDDYYALTAANRLKDTAIDWTHKIDYSKGFKIMSNVKIPKKYLFSYKEDSDYLNRDYKNRYNEPYGSFRFNDSFAIGDEKKVELIFSPSPLVTYVGTGKVHPAIYQVSGDKKSPIKSNIRILYYNGIKKGMMFKVSKDAIINDVQDVEGVADQLYFYPQVGNYFLEEGQMVMTPLEDLYFGPAKFMYFEFNSTHLTVPTAYHKYFKNNVTNITSPDVRLIECEVYLNEVDIAQLDLKTPVYVDMGKMGHAYFRVLNVDYENNTTTSRVTLQRITL